MEQYLLRRTRLHYGDGSDPDWLHANSIDYNEELDQIISLIFLLSENLIIDHSTTTLEASTVREI